MTQDNLRSYQASQAWLAAHAMLEQAEAAMWQAQAALIRAQAAEHSARAIMDFELACDEGEG